MRASLPKIILIISLSMGLSGCAYTAAVTTTGLVEKSLPASDREKKVLNEKLSGSYKTSESNKSVLTQVLGGRKVALGEFDAYEPKLWSIHCRGFIYIKAPRGNTYPGLLKNGLKNELENAGVYDGEKADVSISAKIKQIDLSTTSSGHWRYIVEFTSSNGNRALFTSQYEFEGTTFGSGKSACDSSQLALLPSFQDLVGKFIRSPGFIELTK